MDKLWAPWRNKYITQVIQENKACVFCKIFGEKKDKENYILVRTQHNYSVLNLYPYNNGHVLLVPHRHVNDLSKLKKKEREDLFDLLEATKVTLDCVLKPEGYNIGINLGRVAGAGFPGHLHVHLVPRWKGDMNFMPVTGNTKVISQSLKTLYNQLKNADKKRY
ncbi:MAG TPA: HIT family hydrolase [Candidatus Omnitrophica bacterium]|nr:MAG: HIT family hydrolase [Omnitrophica WOR_2 bacterium GWA2_45_18]OGX19635.1 MAG: HIT family hydrolase [Omnitrophica WOR_2 bacterium GWC2_45_7]HBR14691.1 HIT family hydrolase [Candidatus Omnitrophota bacterium]